MVEFRVGVSFMRIQLGDLVAALTAALLTVFTMLTPMTATAVASDHISIPITIGTMSNNLDASTKDAEGKLESAYGELTGDAGHQIKGKAKQVQASAMNTADNLKQGAKTVAKGISKAADNLADDLS
uniref:CsbD family protein n=1 Tax=Synechococcus sp. CS-1329 TaxID=2847975 RepID=UPI00223AB8F5|nr:CsbD family protein [Synechococcus sp. CS-1329]